jgi:hypothetical protein
MPARKPCDHRIAIADRVETPGEVAERSLAPDFWLRALTARIIAAYLTKNSVASPLDLDALRASVYDSLAGSRARSASGKPERALPVGIAPRGLSRRAAAEYCGLPVSTFDARANEGSLPGPVFRGRRRVWDRIALDHALNSLSGIADEPSNRAEEAALRAIRHGSGKRALHR